MKVEIDNPETWPLYPFLPLDKRNQNNPPLFVDVGILYYHPRIKERMYTIYLVNLYEVLSSENPRDMLLKAEILPFNSKEELTEAGWRIC